MLSIILWLAPCKKLKDKVFIAVNALMLFAILFAENCAPNMLKFSFSSLCPYIIVSINASTCLYVQLSPGFLAGSFTPRSLATLLKYATPAGLTFSVSLFFNISLNNITCPTISDLAAKLCAISLKPYRLLATSLDTSFDSIRFVQYIGTVLSSSPVLSLYLPNCVSVSCTLNDSFSISFVDDMIPCSRILSNSFFLIEGITYEKSSHAFLVKFFIPTIFCPLTNSFNTKSQYFFFFASFCIAVYFGLVYLDALGFISSPLGCPVVGFVLNFKYFLSSFICLRDIAAASVLPASIASFSFLLASAISVLTFAICSL